MNGFVRSAALAAALAAASAMGEAPLEQCALWWEIGGSVTVDGVGTTLAALGADSARIRVTGVEGEVFLPLYLDDGEGNLFLSDYEVVEAPGEGTFFSALGAYADAGYGFSLELGAWGDGGEFWRLASTESVPFEALADCVTVEDGVAVGSAPSAVWAPTVFTACVAEPGGPAAEGGTSCYDVEVVYDGQPHTVDRTVFDSVRIGGQAVTASFSMSQEGPWAADPPAQVEAGVLTFWYRLEAQGRPDFVHAVKVTVKAAVAHVAHGSEIVFHDDLQRAVSSAVDGDRVTMLADVTLGERLEVDLGEGAAVVLDLGGWTLSAGSACAESGAVDVKSGAVSIENGKIDCATAGSVAQGAIVAEEGAAVTLRTLEVEVDSAAGACVYACAGGSVAIESGSYVNRTESPLPGRPEWTGLAVAQAEGDEALVSIAGGTFAKVDPALGGATGRPATFVRDGYISVGAVDASGATLYTVYEKVTVTLEPGNGDAATLVGLGKGFALAEPAAPARVGYTFSGWLKNGVPYDFAEAVAEDMTLTASWTVNQYTLTFDPDGGSAVDPITQDYGTEVAAPTAPTKEGYTFVGWSPAVPATMPASDMTIKAMWTVNQYTLTFDSDGGSAVDPITQDYGTDITAPVSPTKEGYTFAGWTPAVPATMPASDMTIKATWTIVIPDVLKNRETFDEFRSWLILHGLAEADVSDEDVVAAVAREVPVKGTTLVDEFIAGTDPADETSRLLALISMSGKKPIVTWTPNLNGGEGVRVGVRTYHVWGAKTLHGAWVEVPEGKEAEYKFFKVSVSLW